MELETSVAALKEAEAKAANIEREAEARRETGLRDGRAKAAGLVDKGKKDAAELKDKLLAEEMKKTEAEVKAIASKAAKEADAVRKGKVPAGAAGKIADAVFKDLL